MVLEPAGQTLQATALVHEAWIRLAGQRNQHYQNRHCFSGAAAEVMRRILVDRARCRHGLDPTDPQIVSGNPDQDAFTTFQEWLADTDPTNALSYFHIEGITKDSPALVSFQSSSNRTYTLWSTPQLAPSDWAPVPDVQAVSGNGGTLTLSDPANAPRQFYRVQVNLP